MAGMKRFVTYIYSYENKKKGSNIGFAKIEIRGEDCRIEIHLRGVYAWQTVCRVYLFRESAGDIEGIRIGDMKLGNGNGDFGAMIKASKIGESPFGMNDMEGIFLLTEDERIFMSRWKEGNPLEVSRERFKEWQPADAVSGKNMEEPVQKPGGPYAFVKSPRSEETEQPRKEEAEQPREKEAESRRQEAPRKKAAESRRQEASEGSGQEEAEQRRGEAPEAPREDVDGFVAASRRESTKQPQCQRREEEMSQGSTISPPQCQRREEAASQESTVSQPRNENGEGCQGRETVQATEIPMRNVFPAYDWLEIWEKLGESHPVFMPFEDREAVCIQIELKELRELPRRYWYLGNNSFLLHGFFNYRYLVVGKTKEERWFIGVPGIYQRQERVMAAIFGFPEFLPTAVSDEKQEKGEPVNRFGCWFRYIEE